LGITFRRIDVEGAIVPDSPVPEQVLDVVCEQIR
jgi:hypothetical protein